MHIQSSFRLFIRKHHHILYFVEPYWFSTTGINSYVHIPSLPYATTSYVIASWSFNFSAPGVKIKPLFFTMPSNRELIRNNIHKTTIKLFYDTRKSKVFRRILCNTFKRSYSFQNVTGYNTWTDDARLSMQWNKSDYILFSLDEHSMASKVCP